MTPLEAAYVAGLFDGEGTLGYYFKPTNKAYNAQLSITNCDRRVLEWVCKKVGHGVLYANHKNVRHVGWAWHLSGHKHIQAFLIDIRPFLIVKADQVDLLLSLWDAEQKIRGERKRLPQVEVLGLREQTEAELKRLKTANYTSVPINAALV